MSQKKETLEIIKYINESDLKKTKEKKILDRILGEIYFACISSNNNSQEIKEVLVKNLKDVKNILKELGDKKLKIYFNYLIDSVSENSREATPPIKTGAHLHEGNTDEKNNGIKVLYRRRNFT